MPPQKSRLKRLPSHSYSIILKFTSDAKRDEFKDSDEFEKVYGELVKITRHFNVKTEIIFWDSVSGIKSELKDQKIITLEESSESEITE